MSVRNPNPNGPSEKKGIKKPSNFSREDAVKATDDVLSRVQKKARSFRQTSERAKSSTPRERRVSDEMADSDPFVWNFVLVATGVLIGIVASALTNSPHQN